MMTNRHKCKEIWLVPGEQTFLIFNHAKTVRSSADKGPCHKHSGFPCGCPCACRWTLLVDIFGYFSIPALQLFSRNRKHTPGTHCVSTLPPVASLVQICSRAYVWSASIHVRIRSKFSDFVKQQQHVFDALLQVAYLLSNPQDSHLFSRHQGHHPSWQLQSKRAPAGKRTPTDCSMLT